MTIQEAKARLVAGKTAGLADKVDVFYAAFEPEEEEPVEEEVEP